MLFSDLTFFVFFSIYFSIHLITPVNWRISLIIIGSLVFYGWWRPSYVYLPIALTVIAWVGALWIVRASSQASKRGRLFVVLLCLFSPLLYFKYGYFFAKEALSLFPGASNDAITWLKVALPLAVSFITFTLTAYIVDVFKKKYPVERSFSRLLAYVLFFPHLIAGPILRPAELLPQLKRMRPALGARFTLGLALFAIGLVKKVVFADVLAGPVESAYAQGASVNALEYILAIYAYSFQIYCDFSGYTDMAIGIAYMIRIRLPTNFLRPYTAGSLVEFWRRWHVTLSHWLRDYLYVPLGGNRSGKTRQFLNILVTMVLGGLWHGANWTFMVWGFLHGAGLIVVHALRGPFRRAGFVLPRWVGILLTFHFVSFLWVFFRSPDLATAYRVLTGPFSGAWPPIMGFLAVHVFELGLLLVLVLTHRFDRHARVRWAVGRYNPGLIWAVIGLAVVLAVTVSQGSSAKFIYFDF